MKIVRRSPFNGLMNEMEIAVTLEQLREWKNGMMIQRAMPNLTAGEREFIMTGITPQEWEDLFGKGES